jgi:CRP-like cAMP-binding protein
MEPGAWQIRKTRNGSDRPAGRVSAGVTRRETAIWAQPKEEESMQAEARAWRTTAVQAHPLSELLECPAATGKVLNAAAVCLDVEAGQVVFRQEEICQGLYVVVSGHFLRRTERLDTRLTLGMARPGDLVELAAGLGDGHHTYTLSAQTPGSLLMLPIEALNQAFASHPPLRMRLLEELAREVSRAYDASCQNRTPKTRQRRPAGPALSPRGFA